MSTRFKKITLMYHGVIPKDGSQLTKKREKGASLYDVAEADFDDQLHWLQANAENISLTFDDGEENNYSIALPLLKNYGMVGTFFPIVQRVGTDGYCSWDQLKEMQVDGMIIGSHGLTHQILTQLNHEELLIELKESKRILEEHLGGTITCISIPRGFHNRDIIALAQQCGYQHIYISEKNDADMDFLIERIAVMGAWNISRFEMALMGKTPIVEKIISGIILFTKKVCGDRFYDIIRSGLLTIMRKT